LPYGLQDQRILEGVCRINYKTGILPRHRGFSAQDGRTANKI
jgi:hypothetical protein